MPCLNRRMKKPNASEDRPKVARSVQRILAKDNRGTTLNPSPGVGHTARLQTFGNYRELLLSPCPARTVRGPVLGPVQFQATPDRSLCSSRCLRPCLSLCLSPCLSPCLSKFLSAYPLIPCMVHHPASSPRATTPADRSKDRRRVDRCHLVGSPVVEAVMLHKDFPSPS